MEDTLLPAHLAKRLEELKSREISYLEDELYSEEAMTNMEYRTQLERCFSLDPLGPLPGR
jgi:hypothetical protein